MQHKWVPQFLVDRSVEILNRDECRTPMLWSEKPNAGFCPACVEPWLPTAESFKKINVEAQIAEPHSLFNFYEKVIHFRNETPALQAGCLEIAQEFCDKKIWAYRRILNGEKYMVLLNMSRHIVKSPVSSELLLSTHSKPCTGITALRRAGTQGNVSEDGLAINRHHRERLDIGRWLDNTSFTSSLSSFMLTLALNTPLRGRVG